MFRKNKTITVMPINHEYFCIRLTGVYWNEQKEKIEPINEEINKMDVYILPRINELLQYNGIRYRILDIIHHYKKGFKPYVELIVEDENIKK